MIIVRHRMSDMNVLRLKSAMGNSFSPLHFPLSYKCCTIWWMHCILNLNDNALWMRSEPEEDRQMICYTWVYYCMGSICNNSRQYDMLEQESGSAKIVLKAKLVTVH